MLISTAPPQVDDAIDVANRIIQTNPVSSAATIARLRLPALYAAAGDRANTDLAIQTRMQSPSMRSTEEISSRWPKSLAKTAG